MGYRETYESWQNDPEGFWMEEAKAIDWAVPPTKALTDHGDNLFEWFADGMVNTCYNAVDRHVEQGRGDQVAIIHDSPITGTKEKITYAELQRRVAFLGGALAERRADHDAARSAERGRRHRPALARPRDRARHRHGPARVRVHGARRRRPGR